jgi:hypothetical protein
MKRLGAIKKKHVVWIVFAAMFVFLLHNLLYFPPRGSYDAGSHHNYAEYLIKERQLPTREDTVHYHNPPLWYLIGSASILFSEKYLQVTDWRLAIKPWQMTNLIFAFGSLIFWYFTANLVFKKELKKNLVFIIGVFSLPVFIRVSSMLSIEPALMFFSSFLTFYFIKNLPHKTNIKHLVIIGFSLGIAMLFKITCYPFVIVFGSLTVLKVWFYDKKGFVKALLSGLLVGAIIFMLSGWFYIYKAKNYGLFASGRVYETRVQPPIFYSFPFRLMMDYPLRPLIGNRFLPVMYVDFWGDVWNYFPQRRFGITAEHLRTVDREAFNSEKMATLIRQVRLNVFTSLVIIFGFVVIVLRRLKAATKNLFSPKSFESATLMGLFLVTFIGYFYFQWKAPSWDGSNIKPSHIVYIWPVPLLFAVEWLFSLKVRWLRNGLLILLFIPTTFSIWFNWF